MDMEEQVVSNTVRSAESSRRDVLKGAAGLAAAVLAGSGSLRPASGATSPPGGRRRVLRIAHLTDIHVQPELHAGEGMAACLRHAQEHYKPDLVINTGDAIFDSMAASLIKP